MSKLVRGLQRALDAAWSLGHRTGGIRAENTLTPMPIEALVEAIRGALGGESSTGIQVTPREALKSPAFWTSAKVLSEAGAQIPLNVLRPLSTGRGTEVATEAPLQKLIGKRGRPNEWQTAFTLKRQILWQILTRGNFYAFKNFAGGELREILPIVPVNRVGRPELDENFRLTYPIAMPRIGSRRFTRAEVFHVMGDSDDGVAGLNPLAFHADSIGLALAQDRHAGSLFKHGARLWGVIEHERPGGISTEALTRMRESFEQVYAGPENAHKTAILEEGAKFKETSQKAEEAQLLESRQLQRSIVAGENRVPPHMVGDLKDATFSNIENLSLQFVIFVLMPWLENIEAEADQQLLTAAERAAGLHCKFNPEALLRGDSKARAEFYTKMVAIRAMNPNEVRAKEDMNPYEGGDEFINPNIQPVPETGAPEPEETGNRRAGLRVVPPAE